MRKFPPGSVVPYTGERLKRFMDMDKEVKRKVERSSKPVKFQDVIKKK